MAPAAKAAETVSVAWCAPKVLPFWPMSMRRIVITDESEMNDITMTTLINDGGARCLGQVLSMDMEYINESSDN